MINNKHLREKARKEQVKYKNLQAQQEKFAIKREKLSNIKRSQDNSIQEILENENIPENIKNDIQSNKVKRSAKALKKAQKFLIKEHEKNIEKLDIRIGFLNELQNEIEKTPTENDIIEAGKFLIYTQKKVFRKITPIQTYLKQKDFLLDNIDIGDVLEKSGLFRKGIFSRVWKYGKQSKLEIFARNKTLIGFYAGKNMLQKFLMQYYKIRNNIFKSN